MNNLSVAKTCLKLKIIQLFDPKDYLPDDLLLRPLLNTDVTQDVL